MGALASYWVIQNEISVPNFNLQSYCCGPIRAIGNDMNNANNFRWTNKSVLALAGGEDPIIAIERKARELVLRARDQGWIGPPFNPIFIADLLKIPVTANASVADACIVSAGGKLQIQFNPTQVRERVRFSIAHEIAHSLFADVAEEVRNRGGNKVAKDDWQLEILCNLAASEFVMPIGSISAREKLASLEDLMAERRKFDVSAEAFLIRATKIANEPVVMFCASPDAAAAGERAYRVELITLFRQRQHRTCLFLVSESQKGARCTPALPSDLQTVALKNGSMKKK